MESPVVTTAAMRTAEEAAFASGIEVEALMDRAGAGVALAIRKFFPHPGRAAVFVGKGHNGGDALVAASRLRDFGWQIDLRLAFPEDDCAELTRRKLADFRSQEASPSQDIAARAVRLIVLDGLLGLGAKHLLREPVRTHAHEAAVHEEVVSAVPAFA